MKQLHEFFCKEMTFAQAMQEQYANQKQTPMPNYQIGDYVFFGATCLCSDRPSKKLDFKSYGPYPILKQISSYAYQLGLPLESNTYPVFHVNKQRLAPSGPLPGQHLPPPPPLKVSDIRENRGIK